MNGVAVLLLLAGGVIAGWHAHAAHAAVRRTRLDDYVMARWFLAQHRPAVRLVHRPYDQDATA